MTEGSVENINTGSSDGSIYRVAEVSAAPQVRSKMEHTNAPTMVDSMWTITAVALLFILLRLFMKWRYGKKTGWDDWLITFSWVCSSFPHASHPLY